MFEILTGVWVVGSLLSGVYVYKRTRQITLLGILGATFWWGLLLGATVITVVAATGGWVKEDLLPYFRKSVLPASEAKPKLEEKKE